MGVFFADSFNSYSASSDLDRNWTGLTRVGWTWNATAGRTGGGAIQLVSTANGKLAIPSNLFSQIASGIVGMGFWLKCTAAPTTNTWFLIGQFNNTFGSNFASTSSILSIHTTGALAIGFNFSQTAGTVGSLNVCDGNWHYVEVYMGSYGSSAQKCWVDTIQQWNMSFGGGAGDTQVNIVVGGTSSANNTLTISDIYFFDNGVNESPLPTDQPLGQSVIDVFRPNGDSAVQFTRSTGSNNYANVDEVSANDDTDYNSDNVSGHADEYDYEDLAFSPGSIRAVQLVTRAKNNGPGGMQFKTRCRSGATVSDSGPLAVPASYQNNRRIFNRDPATSVAWTGSGFNAAKFGVLIP